MKFVLGFAIGVGLALILAPAPGIETRRRLLERMRELGQLPEKKAEEFADTAKQKAGDLGGRIGREAAEAAVDAVKNDVLGKRDTA